MWFRICGKILCSWYCLGAEVMPPAVDKNISGIHAWALSTVAHQTCKYPVSRISQPSKQLPHHQTQTCSVSRQHRGRKEREPSNCLPARLPPRISSIAGLSFTNTDARKCWAHDSHWRGSRQSQLHLESRTPPWAGLWTLSFMPSMYGNDIATGKPGPRKEEPQGSYLDSPS